MVVVFCFRLLMWKSTLKKSIADKDPESILKYLSDFDMLQKRK